jgi:hypothetical protein
LSVVPTLLEEPESVMWLAVEALDDHEYLFTYHNDGLLEHTRAHATELGGRRFLNRRELHERIYTFDLMRREGDLVTFYTLREEEEWTWETSEELFSLVLAAVDADELRLSGHTLMFARAPELGTVPLLIDSSARWMHVSVSDEHACGITTGGAAYCWGSNEWGVLGIGSSGHHPVPARVAGGHSWRSIAAGRNRTCGITVDGRGYCWGMINPGAGMMRVDVPLVEVPGSHEWDLLMPLHPWLRGDGWLGLRASGQAVCMAYSGQADERPASGSFPGRWTSLATTRYRTCGVEADGRAYCWAPTCLLEDKDTPHRWPVTGATEWATLQATCGLTATGEARCWEDSLLGEDRGDIVSLAVPGGRRWTQLTTAGGPCGVTTDGEAFCWWAGRKQTGGGQVHPAHYGPFEVAEPVRVPGSHRWRQISSAEGGAFCGITVAGHLYCWTAKVEP